jgi:hypothetical protein
VKSASRFAADSPLEGDGFELPVPCEKGFVIFCRDQSPGFPPTAIILLGSTRAIAFCPPSVTSAAPSGPPITPWGAASGPNAIRSDLPVLGSSQPSLPADCAVNYSVPSGAG